MCIKKKPAWSFLPAPRFIFLVGLVFHCFHRFKEVVGCVWRGEDVRKKYRKNNVNTAIGGFNPPINTLFGIAQAEKV